MPFIEHGGKRLLFIHIPKTGGTSIETWMRSVAPLRFHTVGLPFVAKVTPQHYRMHDFRVLFGDGYFDHVIAIVRNPYDRFESEYRMRAELGLTGFWKSAPTFPVWREDVLQKGKASLLHLDAHIMPQHNFIGSGVEIHRFEDGLLSVAARMAELLGVDPPDSLPHEMRTDPEIPKVEWDLADRIAVQEHYARDFKQFDYPV